MKLLTTDQLFLTPIADADIDSLFEIYKDKRNMTFIPQRQRSTSKLELANKYKKHLKNGCKLFTVQCAAASKIMGEAGFFNSFKNNEELEIGYIIDHPYWSKGYGTEICKGLIDYGFQQLNLKAIHAKMFTKNTASIIISQKYGMKKIDEGLDSKGNKFSHYKIDKKQFQAF